MRLIELNKDMDRSDQVLSNFHYIYYYSLIWHILLVYFLLYIIHFIDDSGYAWLYIKANPLRIELNAGLMEKIST